MCEEFINNWMKTIKFTWQKEEVKMHEISELEQELKKMIGLDAQSEILALWYEITYMRMILSEIIEKNDDIKKYIDENMFERAREFSKGELIKRFPYVYDPNSIETIEEKQ